MLYFLLPVAGTAFVVILVVGWGTDRSAAVISSCRSVGLLLVLDFLLPVTATVFVVLLIAVWGIDGSAAVLFSCRSM